MDAKFVRRGVCECGFPLLREDVPIGTLYVVHPADRAMMDLICGGCGKINRCIPSIFVEARADRSAGYLPASIFEIDEGSV
jgi:hypothetical protein